MTERRPFSFLRVLHWGAIVIAGICLLFFGVLTLFVVPAPTEDSMHEVTGVLRNFTPPQREGDDLRIHLEGGGSCYVNRPMEIEHFDWEALVREVAPGDSLTLVVVVPLARRLFNRDGTGCGPVAGVRTTAKTYLDVEISAGTWVSQRHFARLAAVALVVFLLLLVPALTRRRN